MKMKIAYLPGGEWALLLTEHQEPLDARIGATDYLARATGARSVLVFEADVELDAGLSEPDLVPGWRDQGQSDQLTATVRAMVSRPVGGES